MKLLEIIKSNINKFITTSIVCGIVAALLTGITGYEAILGTYIFLVVIWGLAITGLLVFLETGEEIREEKEKELRVQATIEYNKMMKTNIDSNRAEITAFMNEMGV